MRVLSYNIHKGVCYYSRKQVLDELRQGIRSIDPDIVFLQEVRGKSAKGSLGPQFEFLADQMWPHFAYGKNAVYSQGDHGNAILSKYPIVSHHNLDISNSRFERRGLLHAVARVPKLGNLDIFCIHLDLLERSRNIQLATVVDRISSVVQKGGPVLLAGDFNDWRGRVSQKLKRELNMEEAGLVHLGRHAKTFPSVRPTLALDRIYFRKFRLADYEVLKDGGWQNLSDHLAVTAEFTIAN